MTTPPPIPETSAEPGRAALLVAHPGHELLLHHWMECARPVVFALTDGSGGSGRGRLERSAGIIRAAGGTIGSVFGMASDRSWYEAILEGDRRPFDEAAEGIAGACARHGVTRLVVDAFELFNPMHDLAAALAREIARRLRAAGGEIDLLDYPVERPDLPRDPPATTISLDERALERKRAAARSFEELEAEVAHHGRNPEAHATERLYRVRTPAAWPERPPGEVFYEVFGRRRITEGRYRRLITWRDHVRPLVVALGGE